jgi:hypothetical protein
MSTHEQRELRIDTEAGLREFLSHTKELYSALVAAAESHTEQSEMVAAQLSQAETSYHRIRDTIDLCVRSLSLGIAVNDVLIDEVQELYNEIATLYDLFVIESEENSMSPVVPAEAPEGIAVFLEVAKTLAEKASVLLLRYEDISTVEGKTDELNIAKFYYNQLVHEAERAAATARMVETEQLAILNGEALQASVKETLEGINTSLDKLDKELDRFFEPEEDDTLRPIHHGALDASTHTRKDRPTEFSLFIDVILLDARYAEFLKERFHSRSQFETFLKREVEKVEAPSKFDKMLGVVHASAFSFLKDQTLEDIIAFDSLPRQQIKETLSELDIPYEVYVEWMYILADIQSVMQAPGYVSFGELFVRAELELLILEREEVNQEV